MKKWLLIVFAFLVVIQFFQPERNHGEGGDKLNIARKYAVPARVMGILNSSCYDCHSNNTRNPWYSYLQPMGWWMAGHVKQGKRELNFDEFGGYSQRRQQSKLKAIAGSIQDGTMPLGSYTLIHRDARLSEEEKQLILEWTEAMADSISQNK